LKLSDYQKLGKTYIVAEVGQAHDGSLGILYSLVDALSEIGVDAIKFQMHIAHAESSDQEPFRIPFSPSDQSRYDYWKRMELPVRTWEKVKRRCESYGVEFLVTPFSNVAVDALESLGVERYKVGSGDLANKLLIERLAMTGKELILSTGLCSIQELDEVVERLRCVGSDFAVMQCTSSYPSQPRDIGLAWIPQLRERYACPVGLSDHSGTIYPGIGAVSIGASLIEAHVTFDRRMFGPDSRASLPIDEFGQMIEGVRFMELARQSGSDKTITSDQAEMKRVFGKALAVNKDLPVGHVLRFEDLEGKKPADAGISARDFERVIGKALVREKSSWAFLQFEDIEE
jgi:N,N'-diacetyllegionaminate synthase